VAGWISATLGASAALVGFLATTSLAGAILFVVGLAVLTAGLFLLAGAQTVERRVARLAYAGPSPVLVFLATVSTTYVVASLVGVPLELAGIGKGPFADLLLVSVQALVFIGVVRLMVVAPGAVTWRQMGFGRPAGQVLDALGWGALLAVPVVIVTALLGAVLVQLFGVSPASPLPPTGTAGGLVLNLLSGAVVAPFAEEIVFRGMATTAWTRSSGPVAAVVRSSILFALAHVLLIGGDSFGQALALAIVAGAGRLPIAAALGWAYLRRGSIWASIGMHAAFNGILIILGELAVRAAIAG
jgi:membrane protease YdiL (CAAX protease family)